MKIQISHISILSTKLGFKYIKKVTDDTNQGRKELGSQDDLRQKANIYHSMNTAASTSVQRRCRARHVTTTYCRWKHYVIGSDAQQLFFG